MFVTPRCPQNPLFFGRSVTAPAILRAASLIEWRPSPFEVTDAPDKGYEAFDELPKLLLCGIACEPAGFVEDAPGTGHEKASAVPGRRPQRPQNWQPCVLAEDRAKAAGRCPEYRHRLSAENLTDVGRWPREPVNCVLEHARDRVVVFGRREEQPICGDDRLL